jgi:hypothetical protein
MPYIVYRKAFIDDDHQVIYPDYEKIVLNNEIDKLDMITEQNVYFISACIKYDNVELLQMYISKFNNIDSDSGSGSDNNEKVIIYNHIIFQLFDLQRTNMINMLIKNNINTKCILDFIDEIQQLKKILEYCRVNDFAYSYTNVLIDNLSQLAIIPTNAMELDEIFQEYNLEYKMSDYSIDYATCESLEWFYKKYKDGYIKFEYSHEAIQNAITTNSIELLKWWIDHSDEFELKYIDLYFPNAKIETLKFLLSEQDTIKVFMTPEIFMRDFISYHFDVDNDQIIIYDYLYDTLIKNNYDLKLGNANINSVNTLDWLYSKFKLGQIDLNYTKQNFIQNISDNAIDCVKWWISHNDEFNIDIVISQDDYYYSNYDNCYDEDENVIEDEYDDQDYMEMKVYIEHFTLKMAEYLYFEQKVIEMNICSKMIDRMFVRCEREFIDLFYHNIVLLNEMSLDYTSYAIDFCIDTFTLDWWLEHMDVLELKYTSKSLDYNLINNIPKCIKWWYDNRFIIKPKFTRDLLIKYVNEYPNTDHLLELLDFQ